MWYNFIRGENGDGYRYSGRIKVKVFTFEGNCDIIGIENKKTEKYYNAKNFESAF